jgi:tetratricopeptide (TPR) repeat protein
MNATNRRTLAALGCLLLGLSLCLARAEDKGKSDADIVQSVWSRLIAVAEPVAGLEWPPPCTLEKDNAINAFAAALRIRKPASEGKQPANGSWAISPRVVVFNGMMTNVIRTSGDKDADAAADRLAYILGHELSHITLGHVTSPREGETSLARQVFSREQEIAADVRGAELALKAGFSLRRGLDSIRRMQKLGLEYSSFEGLHAGHPSWNDRLVHLDKEQAGLWKTMSAFQNGAFFLMTEQFASAEVCFRAVTREFPNCHEAWANLGYALLMQYCDGLDTEDVRRFGIGQIAIGGFYRRPKSLEPETRGIQTKLWQEAVTCLQKSLQLKNSQSIAKAHLGVAYLVHPDGKPDLARASLYLNQAVITDKVAARSTREIDSLAIAAISVNAGEADLAAGRNDAAAQKFDDGEKFGGLPFGTYDGPSVRTSVASALAYNRAVLFAGGGPEKQAEAAQLFEAYLELTGSGGAWWPLAYEKYVTICKKIGRELRPKGRSRRTGRDAASHDHFGATGRRHDLNGFRTRYGRRRAFRREDPHRVTDQARTLALSKARR